ncbi:apolipoprotein N-acyltransferase [Thermocrinis sp.]
MKTVFLSILAGLLLYIPFSKLNLWFLLFPSLLLFLKYRSFLFWSLGGYVFLFLSLRCANIASVEFGGVHPIVSYSIFSLFVLVLTLFQFSLPAFLSWRFFKNSPLAYSFLYTLAEWIRSHFPFGGFPWLLLGEVLSQVPLFKHSLYFIDIPIYTFLVWLSAGFILQKKFIFLFLQLSILTILSLLSYRIEPQIVRDLKVALVQTAVPQQDKLDWEKFSTHEGGIIKMIELALKEKPALIVLPESALPFYFSEDKTDLLYELSLQGPILLGLIDIRDNLKPYNSAYLFAEGRLVDHYDKVKLMPIGEFIPKPFEFLKEIFEAIGGIDYVPGERIETLNYKNLSMAVPICFEVAHYNYMEKLTKNSNLIVVLTNDGWFKDSDCAFQHFRFAQWSALRFKKFVLWVNNSGDTAIIDPHGRVIRKMGYMERGILVETLK